ncbi:MAG: hypothetical protein Tsb0032_00150 [Kiloniellaceae bacterium]
MKSDAVTHGTSPLKTHSDSTDRQRRDAGMNSGDTDESRTKPALPASADDHALFLDVDGTLLPIAAHPDAVRVSPALLSRLEALRRRLGGALALVSGRAIADLDRLFTPLRLPCAGVHGLERRTTGGTVVEAASAELLGALREPLADFVRCREGLLLEDKRQSLALHFRNAPEHESEVKALVSRLAGNIGPQLELTHGKMVVEVKPAGVHKGTAVEAFMAEAPFAGRVPIFIGDDVTDEDGFRSVNEMAGLSIRVGESETTAAEWSLPDEDAVSAWLQPWAAETPADAGMSNSKAQGEAQ